MHLLVGLLLGGCDSSGSDYFEAGECDPPADGSDLAPTAVALDNILCTPDLPAEVVIVGSQPQWDALFSECGQPVPLPAGIDLANQRAAVAQIDCAPLAYRFTSERADEIVIGVYTWPTGACIGNPVAVALPQATKPVRLAHCYQSCRGECPPLP